MTTTCTGFGRWEPTVNEMEHLALASGNVLQNIAELTKGDVSDLAAPKPVHSLDIQRFQNDDVKAVGEVVSQLEEPVPALVGNPLMYAGKVVFGLMPVSRSFSLPGHSTVSLVDLLQASFEELRRSDLFAVGKSQESFQTEVRANDGVTQSVDFFLFHINGKADEQLTKWGALDRDGLDRVENFPAFAELVHLTPNANLVRTNQLPTGLFKGEGSVFSSIDEAIMAYNVGEIAVHAAINVRMFKEVKKCYPFY